MDDELDKPVELGDDDIAKLVEKKATCPFIGSAIAQGALPVRNSAADPLARLEDVRALGNSGGGDLGDLLVLFAAGNHAFMRGSSGQLDQHVPAGLFSLAFPGSQGSHPGHSGILQGDPTVPDSGRFSADDFARLAALGRDGWIRRSDIGRFIADNLLRDPAALVFGTAVARLLGSDLLALAESAGTAWMRRIFGSDDGSRSAHRDMEEKLTRLLGQDNLVGSAGEFGLLFAFFANRPDAREVDGEPALAVADLQAMFIAKRLPDGWDTWKKKRIDWVKNTTALLVAAAREYLARKPRT
ncbi:hypothetical protein [Thauera sp. 2A1]|uniref:hypothetical protein n=1 Tax=Thauera sp. 2A1 TaxID=2570191 RepID=UPI001291701A|nr:hypothetical protein [Thauera sp. 2A1]KAI5913292.1 hypothetical protein GH664_18750 [Thauera sp. 2A1]